MLSCLERISRRGVSLSRKSLDLLLNATILIEPPPKGTCTQLLHFHPIDRNQNFQQTYRFNISTPCGQDVV